MGFNDKPRSKPPKQRINRQIRAQEIRVIDNDKNQLGVMPLREAIKLAEESGLDLVEISPQANPPVCRIMDFGKFKYEESKKKTHNKVVETKEVKFRPRTEEHDIDFKVNHAKRFLEEGHKVRLVVAFKGAEIAHPKTGNDMLENVMTRLNEVAAVEQAATLEGKQMIMTIARKK